jgi:hypothetical protein
LTRYFALADLFRVSIRARVSVHEVIAAGTSLRASRSTPLAPISVASRPRAVGPVLGTGDGLQVDTPGEAGPLMPALPIDAKSMVRFAAPSAHEVRVCPKQTGFGVSRSQAGFASRRS